MAPEDLCVVAKAWFPAKVISKLKPANLIKECSELGFSKPKKTSFSEMMIYCGDQLVTNDFVTCKKNAGFSRKDVVKNVFLV